jgi:uncharacterized protein (DUF697 family)
VTQLPSPGWTRPLYIGAATGRGLAGNALAFVQIMREVDPGAVQREIRRPAQVLVSGTEPTETQQLASALFGPAEGWRGSVSLVPPAAIAGLTQEPDVVLLVIGPGEPADAIVADFRRRRPASSAPIVLVLLAATAPEQRRRGSEALALAFVAAASKEPEQVARQTAQALLAVAPELALSLGARFRVIRAAASEKLIRESSLANAQFALVSSLPANIPLVGGFAGDMADMVLLTKNQGLLVYKLAGLHGRDLDKRLKLLLEIAPVVGGAFFWRSVARSLLGLLPGVVGGIPKAAVAYVGTYVVGQIARYYYATGERPTPEVMRRFSEEGARLARELASRLGRS